MLYEGYDSDVAREKSIDYSTKTYANPIRQSSGLKPNQRDYDDSSERYIFTFEYVLQTHILLANCELIGILKHGSTGTPVHITCTYIHVLIYICIPCDVQVFQSFCI